MGEDIDRTMRCVEETTQRLNQMVASFNFGASSSIIQRAASSACKMIQRAEQQATNRVNQEINQATRDVQRQVGDVVQQTPIRYPDVLPQQETQSGTGGVLQRAADALGRLF